jgi:hypothetical protein
MLNWRKLTNRFVAPNPVVVYDGDKKAHALQKKKKLKRQFQKIKFWYVKGEQQLKYTVHWYITIYEFRVNEQNFKTS